MALLVDLRGIDPRGKDKRGIHGSAPRFREKRPRKVDQAVQEEHDAVLVAVTLPGKDAVRKHGVLVCDGQAEDAVVGCGHDLPPGDVIGDDRFPDHHGNGVALFHLDRPDLAGSVEIPDQHRVIRGHRDLPAPPGLEPDQGFGCPVDRYRGDPAEVCLSLAIECPDEKGPLGIRVIGAEPVDSRPGEVKILAHQLRN